MKFVEFLLLFGNIILDHGMHVLGDSCSGSSTCRAETLFVMDSSGSVGFAGWNNAVSFVNGVIDGVSGSHTHFGIIEFDNDVNTIYSLCDSQDDCDLIKDELSGKGNLYGGSTNIGDAVQAAIDMFDPNNGGCDDPDLVNVMILISDGEQTTGTVNSCDLKAQLQSLDIHVFLVEVGTGVAAAINCLVDDVATDIFSVPDFSAINDIIDTISAAVCSVDPCGFTACDDEVGCTDCADGYFQPSFDYSSECASCHDTFGYECLSCADFVGCTSCDYEYELVYDEECGLYRCEEESCGPAPTPCDIDVDEAGCPVACDSYPCSCNDDCQFCISTTCHVNGCDQCEDGYFKKSFNHPCIHCQDYFGDGCMSCQDFDGCGQCKTGYQRVYNSNCELWECQ